MDDKFYKAYAEKLNELQSNSSNKRIGLGRAIAKIIQKRKA
jgi:hypothetical protein